MKVCPHCGSKNLEGADLCNDCQHSLTDMSIPRLATRVERGLLKDSIQTLEPKAPCTVSPDTPIRTVLDKMATESTGCVMIVQDDKLLGIFSERDALMKLNAEATQLAERPVTEFMTSDPITLEAKNRIAFALHKMHVGGYRHIPILTEGKLTGVISIRDILAYLSEQIGLPA